MATRSTAAQLDLVCGMPLDPSGATAFSEHAGHTHHFCSRGCKAVFDKNPNGFLTSERANTLDADGPCGRQG
jgi:Cu+-exporting ATPase